MVKRSTEPLSIGEIKRNSLQTQIMSLLYEYQETTVSVLSKNLSLSLPTIRNMVDSLIAQGSVVVKGNVVSRGGRNPLVYQLNKDAFCVCAAELDHHEARMVILNCHNEPVSSHLIISTHIDDHQLAHKLLDGFEKLLAETNIQRSRIVGVGVSMPGLVDSVLGVNLSIKEVVNKDVKANIQSLFNMNVVVENDARMEAYGELLFGKVKNTANSLVVHWGWGLGLGIIHNGALYSGSQGFAGEFSHIRIISEGDLCECGKTGCLQTIASLYYLMKIARKAVSDGVASKLTSTYRHNIDQLKLAHIVAGALKGDELSLVLLRKVSENLAWGLSILIQLYNPEMILIKGPLAAAGPHVTIPLSMALNQYCLNEIAGKVLLDIESQDGDMGLKGVAAMVFKKKFNSL